MILLVGALLGLAAVAFGAFAEHGLRAEVPAAVFHSVQTALRIHQVHAVVVTAIGLAALPSTGGGLTRPGAAGLAWAAWLFALGTVLFSFTIYAAAVWEWRLLVRTAPLGGGTLMAGWLVLAWTGIRSLADRQAG